MNGNKDMFAQAVYLAQLEAAKGDCNCMACQILRKANAMATAQFLNPTEVLAQATPPGPKAKSKESKIEVPD